MRRTKSSGHTTDNLPEYVIGLFKRNGYIRTPSPTRLKEGHQSYKKGWEVRLVLKNNSELSQTRQLLTAAGLKPPRPFRKSLQWIQPLYGQRVVNLFLNKSK
jgi:hypothetical protein